jgi:hypothetical protein
MLQPVESMLHFAFKLTNCNLCNIIVSLVTHFLASGTSRSILTLSGSLSK